MNRALKLAAAVLPLIGLAGLWWQSQQTYDSGTEWEVPIQGFDPRDFLRGHYVEFTYDWPGIEEFRDGPPAMLCLVGTAPQIERAERREETTAAADAACAHPVRADRSGVYGWDALLRGRLYVDQDRAGVMQRELQKPDQRGIVTIRQREDGSFTPISIRFRPLTPEEKAERDARNAAPPGPPAIMEVSP